MTWLSRLAFWRPEQKAANFNDVIARLMHEGGGESDSGVAVTEDVALKVSTVLACVTLIANDVASMPLRVRRATGTGTAVATDAPEYALLFKRPNEWQSAFEFRQMMTAQAVLRGEAFALKVMSGGRVRELWPLQKSEVEVRREDGEIRYSVNAYEGDVSGDFGRDKVMHLRGFTWDGWRGRDRMALTRNAVGLASAALSTQSKAFRNGGRMPGYWTTDQPLGDAIDHIVEQLRTANTGENQWKSPLLDNGIEWKSTSNNFGDSQMVETRRLQMVEICAAFNVVPAVLGIDDKTQAFASVEAMMRWHLQHTLRPWLTLWEQAIDRDVLDTAAGPLFAQFDTRDLEKASTSERADAYRNLVELGIMTRNEARELEGLPPLPGLDTPLTPLNMTGGADETVA